MWVSCQRQVVERARRGISWLSTLRYYRLSGCGIRRRIVRSPSVRRIGDHLVFPRLEKRCSPPTTPSGRTSPTSNSFPVSQGDGGAAVDMDHPLPQATAIEFASEIGQW